MMSDGYFLGVDVGSASVRAGLYSAQGERLSFATRPISQFHASNARVEQSSAEIWQQVCAVVREAVDSSGISPDAIRSIGFDATCSLVALDAEGNGLSVSPTVRLRRTSLCGWIIVLTKKLFASMPHAIRPCATWAAR